MNFFFEFNNLVSKVNRELKSATRKLKTCPKGNLACIKNGKKYIFYDRSYTNGVRNRISLTGNDKAQVELACKACLQSDYEVLSKAKEILTKAKIELENLFIKNTPYAPANAAAGDVLSLKITDREWHEHFLKDKFPMLSPDVLAESVNLLDYGQAWMKQDYPRNPMHFDLDENYISSDGRRFRSKAELLISEMVIHRNLAYRNEEQYKVGWNTYYPDFTIMHPRTGELYYLEYFGLMDDPDYYAKAMRKIAAYQTTPDAARFIFIYESESAPFDSAQIENILDRYFMD